MNKKNMANIGLCLVIFFCVAFLLQKIHKTSDVVTLLKPEVSKSDSVNFLADDFKLEDFNVKFGQVAHRVDASFSLHNESKLDVRNITLFCSMHGEDGKKWSDGIWLIFDKVSSGETRLFSFTDKRYISHLAVSHKTTCQVVDLEIIGQVSVPVSHGEAENHGDESTHHD